MENNMACTWNYIIFPINLAERRMQESLFLKKEFDTLVSLNKFTKETVTKNIQECKAINKKCRTINNMNDSQILPRNKQRKSPLKSTDFRGLWSEWGDSNSQHPAPKAGALPIALHPVISFSLPRLVPGIFRVCGHSCGQPQISNQIQPAPKPPVRPCVKHFRAFALGAMDAAVFHPKAGALPAALHPVIFRHTPYFNTHRRVMQCFFRCDFLRFMLNSSCI